MTRAPRLVATGSGSGRRRPAPRAAARCRPSRTGYTGLDEQVGCHAFQDRRRGDHLYLTPFWHRGDDIGWGNAAFGVGAVRVGLVATRSPTRSAPTPSPSASTVATYLRTEHKRKSCGYEPDRK